VEFVNIVTYYYYFYDPVIRNIGISFDETAANVWQ